MRCLILVFFLFALAGCESEPDLPRGVVAVVNGTPIHLRLVEAVQDFGSVGLGITRQESVESLKRQYGDALAVLIVRTLVMQALETSGIGINEARLERIESDVRSDYPEGEFEKALTEDNISLDIWRELTRMQVAMDTFSDEILKGQIYVPLNEMEEFYDTNKNQFKLPRTLALRQASGADAAIVAAARTDLLKNPAKIIKDDHLFIQNINMRKESVPKEWQKDVYALSIGQATPVKNYGDLYQFVLLVDVKPERQLSLLEAYPLVESILLEEKLAISFDEWLAKALAGAKIKLSAYLIPPAKKENQDKIILN